jgi:RNA polymerase sigma factor (sigma-70 family)
MWNPELHLPLLESARSGDPAALQRLLVACRPDVRRYAQRHCLLSDVDDAVQEALLAVSRHLRALRAAAAFSGWLIRIVQRECRRLGRIALRYDPYDEAALEAWLGARDDDTLRLELSQALEALPAHYREVVLLRDFEELTIREIAARLQLTVPATKSRLHRARELMREYLLP